jgi:peptidoglycan/xylan/chitin deacetylase (PgdA/CDA1 family)
MRVKSSRIPFADRRGLPVWPNGARMAVLVYTAPEQWNWDENETIKPAGTFAGGRGSPPSISTQSAVDYGFHIGLPRMREIFADFDMRVTMWTSGVSVEQFPDVLRDLAGDGHEINPHGYSQGRVIGAMDVDEQRAAITRARALVESVSGRTPVGWISPAAEANDHTLDLLAETGFDYHGDLQDDELPYFVHVGDRRLVEIPYRLAGNLNDLSLFTRSVHSVSDGIRILTDAFDAYYQAASTRPLLFNYGTHPYLSGRPDTALILRALLEHIHRYSDVWVTNYGEVAAWWRKTFESKISAETGVIDVRS